MFFSLKSRFEDFFVDFEVPVFVAVVADFTEEDGDEDRGSH